MKHTEEKRLIKYFQFMQPGLSGLEGQIVRALILLLEVKVGK
jgi:hypothetical protein